MRYGRIGITNLIMIVSICIVQMLSQATLTNSSPTYYGTSTDDHLGKAMEKIDVDGDDVWEIAIMNETGVWIYEYDAILQTFSSSLTSNILQDDLDDLAVGDFDNDGYQDLAVSDYDADDTVSNPPVSDAGMIKIYTGDSNGNLTCYGNPIYGTSSGSDFGYSMDAGDFNDDGYDDLLVSAKSIANILLVGEVYIYWGGSTIFSTSTTISSSQDFNYIGVCVRNIGDINDDDYPDIEISGNFDDTGATFDMGIYNGGTTISSSPNKLLHPAQDRHWAGSDVDCGDINGDGYSDMITGWLIDMAKRGEGLDYMLSIGDVDDYDPSNSYCTGVLIFLGSQYGFRWNESYYFADPDSGSWEYPPYDIVSFGDENYDGYDEILLSRPTDQSDYGNVICWSGSSTLTNQTTPDWEISGTQANQYFGYSRPYAGKALCGMPDTDDNFCDEVFIGSPYWDDTGASLTDSGKVDYYK